MSDRTPILEAKRRLPLPTLMANLGLADHAKKSAPCFIHKDGNNSFSIWQGDNGLWQWKCFAGCGHGDEITLLEKVRGIDRGEAIRLYLSSAQVGHAEAKPRPAKSDKPFDWQQCLKSFKEEHARILAQSRGLHPDFVMGLHRRGLVGRFDGKMALPVHDEKGNVVACHYRAPYGDANWRYFPTGHKVRPLVIGDVSTADTVMVFESQWDAFAVMALMDGAGQKGLAYIVTRGAGNGHLVAGLIPAGRVALAWKQNDPEKNGKRAGDEWLKDVAKAAGVEVRCALTPEPHKDANDWLRAGMTAADVYLAGKDAEMVSPPPAAPRSLDDLLTQVYQFLCDFVVFPEDDQAVAVTLWIAHTWVLEAFTFTAYLGINSPVKRCGKSTLLDCLTLTARRPWLVVTPSPAVLFRKIERDCPTLLLDEVDTIFSAAKGDDGKEELRAVLNAGFQRGAKVSRCVGANFDLKDFAVFCPKALAGIGKLPDTVADRSIPIVLARKGKDDVVQKFRHRDVAPRAQEIQEGLAGWAQDPSVIPALAAARPTIPVELGDRAADICEPLLALAELAGGHWPEAAKKAVVKLTTGKAVQDENVPIQLLTACREIFATAKETRLSSVELLNALIELEDDGPWAIWWEKDMKAGHTKGPAGRLSRLLKPFDIYPKVFRENDATFRGYDRQYFDAAFSRYLPKSEK